MSRSYPRTASTLKMIALGAVLAVGPLAAAAAAADYYLKLGDIKGESTDKGHKDQIDVLSWSWGASDRAAGKVDSVTFKQGTARAAAGGDDDGDGRADVAKALDKASPKLAEARGESDQKAGDTKRHGKATPKLAEARLPNQGSLTLLVPAGVCVAGSRYHTAEFGSARARYILKDVIITSCTPSGSSSQDRPMESLSLNYSGLSR